MGRSAIAAASVLAGSLILTGCGAGTPAVETIDFLQGSWACTIHAAADTEMGPATGRIDIDAGSITFAVPPSAPAAFAYAYSDGAVTFEEGIAGDVAVIMPAEGVPLDISLVHPNHPDASLDISIIREGDNSITASYTLPDRSHEPVELSCRRNLN